MIAGIYRNARMEVERWGIGSRGLGVDGVPGMQIAQSDQATQDCSSDQCRPHNPYPLGDTRDGHPCWEMYGHVMRGVRFQKGTCAALVCLLRSR